MAAAPPSPPDAATPATPEVPKLTPEQRANAVKHFARGKQVQATGNLDYAIEIFLDCAKRDPGNLGFRQELRKAERKKYDDNKKGKKFAFLSTFGPMIKLSTASARKKYLQVIDLAEAVFLHNPWHTRASILQSYAFDQLGLKDLALWTLDQARSADPNNHRINRPMARLFEDRGQYNQAIALWKLVHKKCPRDLEASKKATNLAASATIKEGGYDDAASGKGPSPIKKDSTTHRTVVEGETASEAMSQDRIAKDENMLLKRIADQPANALNYLQLGQLYRRNDMIDKARDVFKKGLGAAGKNFEIELELGDLDIEPFRRDLAITQEKLLEEPTNADLKSKRDAQAKEINARELGLLAGEVGPGPDRLDGPLRDGGPAVPGGVARRGAIQEFQKLRSDPKHKVRVLIHLGLCFIARNNWRLDQKNLEDGLANLTAAEENFRKEVMYLLAVGYSQNNEMQRAIDLGSDLANLDFSYKDIVPPASRSGKRSRRRPRRRRRRSDRRKGQKGRITKARRDENTNNRSDAERYRSFPLAFSCFSSCRAFVILPLCAIVRRCHHLAAAGFPATKSVPLMTPVSCVAGSSKDKSCRIPKVRRSVCVRTRSCPSVQQGDQEGDQAGPPPVRGAGHGRRTAQEGRDRRRPPARQGCGEAAHPSEQGRSQEVADRPGPEQGGGSGRGPEEVGSAPSSRINLSFCRRVNDLRTASRRRAEPRSSCISACTTISGPRPRVYRAPFPAACSRARRSTSVAIPV